MYVYAVTSRGQRRIAARGIAGEPLRRIRVNRIDVIVGDLRKPPRPTPANLRKHIAIVEKIAAAHSAALPARFGTTAHSDEELAIVVRARQRSLAELLANVRSRAQMTIRVVGRAAPRKAAGRPHARGAGPAVGRSNAGTDYLRRRAAQARDVSGFDPIRGAVERWVRDERVEHHQKVATVYHLIPRGSIATYRAALERAATTAGTRLMVSGPWAPYAFASF